MSKSVLLFGGLLCALSSGVGCGPHENVQMIGFDATGGVATFTLNHRGWPAPMRWPGVSEVSVASEADDAELWHLVAEAPGGVPAKELTIVYGVVPRGFSQTVPVDGGRPKKLVTGQNYYIGAGGKECVFGVVFALPLVTTRPVPENQPVDEGFPKRDLFDKMRGTSQPTEGAEPANPTAPEGPREEGKRDDRPPTEPEETAPPNPEMRE